MRLLKIIVLLFFLFLSASVTGSETEIEYSPFLHASFLCMEEAKVSERNCSEISVTLGLGTSETYQCTGISPDCMAIESDFYTEKEIKQIEESIKQREIYGQNTLFALVSLILVILIPIIGFIVLFFTKDSTIKKISIAKLVLVSINIILVLIFFILNSLSVVDLLALSIILSLILQPILTFIAMLKLKNIQNQKRILKILLLAEIVTLIFCIGFLLKLFIEYN